MGSQGREKKKKKGKLSQSIHMFNNEAVLRLNQNFLSLLQIQLVISYLDIDLARSKREALGNILIIYSHKKNKIMQMLISDGKKNGDKINRSYQQKEKKQLCTHNTLFFIHFFDVVLHDYNMKLSSYTSYVGNVLCAHQKFCCLCSRLPIFAFFFFFTAIPFYLQQLAASIPHFLPPVFMFFFQQNLSPLFFYLTCQLFLSYPHH